MAEHMEFIHSKLNGTVLPITSKHLARLSYPMQPSFPVPPPLPPTSVPWPLVYSPSPVRAGHGRKSLTQLTKPLNRWSHLGHQDQEEMQSTVISLGDLSLVEHHPPEIIIRQQDAELEYHFSLPQPVQTTLIKEPPMSCSFNSLAHRVAQHQQH